MRSKIISFLNSHKGYPILLGIATGIQPLLYLYSNNFNLINSWSQFLFLIITFILLPIVVFLICDYALRIIKKFEPYKSRIFSVLNYCLFTFLIVFVTYGLNKKKILLASLCIAFILALIFHKHLKKVIVFQLLLASLAVVKITPNIYDRIQYSYDWQNQPDNIENVEFKKHPNIYLLQPDGFVGFDEINKGYYNFDNSDIEAFLINKEFNVYNDFRSNYTSTLTSNSSMFSMKHHYYGKRNDLNKFYYGRNIIVNKNPVINILKNNDYKTHLILDVPYFISNRPHLAYDYCNIDLKEIDFLSRGFEFKKDTQKDLFEAMQNSSNSHNFYFIRHPYPGHIQTRQVDSKGKDVEREIYLERLKKSNIWLKEIISKILEKDTEALIIISSDHGGFVGFDYTLELQTKTTDRDLVYSMLSSVLAIKWPDNKGSNYKNELKSSVNLFRVLFSYLSEDDIYLDFLEDDSSYNRINKDAPEGVYEIINDEGEVVFNYLSN